MNEIDDIKEKLWKIKNAETFTGREITTEDYVRDVNFLLELVHKSQGMANEINILVAENKRLREALEMYADKSNYGTHHEENRNIMGRWYESDYITIDFGPEIAQAALNQTGCTCGDDSHHGNDRHHAPTG